MLQKENAETSGLVIDYFKSNGKFIAASKEQTELIVKRDEEDGRKLAKGIQVGLDRGSLTPIAKQDYKIVDVYAV